VSGEAASDEFEGSIAPSGDDPEPSEPPTENPSWMGGHPSLADPPPGNPSTDSISIQNKELQRTDSTQKIEREHERAKEKHALNLAEFKRRWPTIAADDQNRVDNAWFALTVDEGEASLSGIMPFLENQKRLKKSHPPAGFNYLGQKRWTLLEQPKASATPTGYPRDSVEAKALMVLHEIAGCAEGFRKIYRGSDGSIGFRKEVTPRIAALAQAAASQSNWVVLTHPQACAWEKLLSETVTIVVRRHPKQGDRAPWPWPPSVDGKIYPSATGPPETLMTDQDLSDFK
jgi:hypothetical protein